MDGPHRPPYTAETHEVPHLSEGVLSLPDDTYGYQVVHPERDYAVTSAARWTPMSRR